MTALKHPKHCQQSIQHHRLHNQKGRLNYIWPISPRSLSVSTSGVNPHAAFLCPPTVATLWLWFVARYVIRLPISLRSPTAFLSEVLNVSHKKSSEAAFYPLVFFKKKIKTYILNLAFHFGTWLHLYLLVFMEIHIIICISAREALYCCHCCCYCHCSEVLNSCIDCITVDIGFYLDSITGDGGFAAICSLLFSNWEVM